jgi:Asp-tRNA(Asn)/Glu-tRNA(Gln) amidotransferase B subunit
MEVVTEPDFATAEQVRAYLLLLRQTLRYLGVSDADMEKGQMRCEPTVNLVDPEAGQRTPRVEIKNLNSMRSVYEAVRYELARQRRCLETGEEMFQETRRWDEAGAVTATMRRKETADDYMYFPDPDLVPLMPERAWVEAVAASLPELPGARRRRFMDDYGLPAYDAGVLTEEAALAGYFEAVAAAAGDPKAAANRVMVEVLREGEPKARLTQLAVEVLVRKAPELPAARQGRFVTQYGLPADEAGVLAAKADLAKYYEEVAAAAGDPKAASNWVMTEVLRVLNEHGIGIAEFRLSVPPAHIAELIALQRDGVISSTIAKEVFARACADGRSPRAIVEEDGLAQISDAGELDKLVAEAIAANPKAVEDYRGGKEKALGAIVGHVMRASKGQANPGVVNDLVRRHLSAG